MGGDGGSIPKRIELVRSRQKPEQVAKEAELAARWRHCQLSQEVLLRPIVACQLGRLYNKTAALEFLLDREKFGSSGEAFGHIRSLRDLRELQLAENPEHRPGEVAKGSNASAASGTAPPFVCPLSGVEMNGRFRFVFPWACGCVLAEKALERLAGSGGGRSGGGACPACQRPDAMSDLVQLNPAGEAELAAATEAMTARRRRLREAAKAASSSSSAKAAEKRKATTSAGPDAAKIARPSAAAASTSASASAAISASRGNSLTSASAASRGGVQNDPSASAAFKSLFTSSKEAKSQPKAHWVTFNPGYFR